MPDLGLEVLWKGKNFVRLLGGLWVALRISLIAAGISIVLGILLGVAASRKRSVSSAILRVYSRMVSRFFSEICFDGMMQAESPEWMPASSICSITAGTKAWVPSQIASASHSMALWRKRSMRIGRSGVTPTAAAI